MRNTPDFPRYLKGSKLFIDIDVDYIYVGFASFLVSVGIVFMLNIPILVAMLIIMLGIAVPLRAYHRIMKTASPGYLKHYMHELGIVKKKGKGGINNRNLPYGFEREFED